MTTQQELASRLTELFPDAIVKKVDKDNFLDIHLPSVNDKKGTHLFFNTAGGNIKIGFYCRDKEFVEKTLSSSDKVEQYSQGIRPKGNPGFNSTDQALSLAAEFILSMIGKYNTPKIIDNEKVSLEIDEEFIMSFCSAIREHKILPSFPFIVYNLKNSGYELTDIKNCFFYAEHIFIGDNNENNFNLLVDHNGFHSSLGGKEFKIIFSWDTLSEIKTKTTEDNSYTMVGLFQSDGRYLSLSQENSCSLLIVKFIFSFVMHAIIMEFKDEPYISWTKVDEMGIKRVTFNSYDDLYNIFNEIKSKYGLKREGFLTNFFKKRLKSKLDNDTELQQALKDADKELDSLRDYIKKTEKEGRPVPNYVKKYL